MPRTERSAKRRKSGATKSTPAAQRSRRGYFGEYGGRFAPETLMSLHLNYLNARNGNTSAQ